MTPQEFGFNAMQLVAVAKDRQLLAPLVFHRSSQLLQRHVRVSVIQASSQTTTEFASLARRTASNAPVAPLSASNVGQDFSSMKHPDSVSSAITATIQLVYGVRSAAQNVSPVSCFQTTAVATSTTLAGATSIEALQMDFATTVRPAAPLARWMPTTAHHVYQGTPSLLKKTEPAAVVEMDTSST